MGIGFLNLALLAGLAALAIPPIIHFLNRRRHDVVDWGAMQFLLVSPAKRRRFMMEELLLMALRMALIALLVLAFAAPYVSGSLVANWTRPPRDTVLLLDGSYSMQQSDGKTASPWEQAMRWSDDWLQSAHAGDRVAFFLATQPPQPIMAELTTDQTAIREALAQLPPPTGNADWPRSVADAWTLLRDQGQARRRDIILLTDHQKYGWADAATLIQWQTLARRIHSEREAGKDDPALVTPSLWAVKLGSERAGPNLRLAPLSSARTVAGVGQRLRFTTTLYWEGIHDRRPPRKIEVTIGTETHNLTLPEVLESDAGRLPLSFEHRFTKAGVQLVSVAVIPEEGQDTLAPDNQQHLALEIVQELPVLIIDGDQRVDAESASYFLTRAFADPADKTKTSFVMSRVVLHSNFGVETALAKTPPRVVILADVPRLTQPQLASLTRFVESGGGLLIVLGPRAEREFYNEQLYRDGKGLLPARLDRVETVKAEQAIMLDVKRFVHPALELFRAEPDCTLGQAAYTRWWKATAETQNRGSPVALFSNGDPWLFEKTYGQGRVIMSTLPMDRSWDGHLPKTWEFPVLAHELIFALADARSGGFNLAPGEALRLQGDPPVLPTSVTLFKPDGTATTRTASQWPFLWSNLGPPGVYRVRVGDGPAQPVVVHADARESDLTPASDTERQQVADLLGLHYLDDLSSLDRAGSECPSQEIWWLFLLGGMGLFCMELWLTRRMALARGRG